MLGLFTFRYVYSAPVELLNITKYVYLRLFTQDKHPTPTNKKHPCVHTYNYYGVFSVHVVYSCYGSPMSIIYEHMLWSILLSRGEKEDAVR